MRTITTIVAAFVMVASCAKGQTPESTESRPAGGAAAAGPAAADAHGPESRATIEAVCERRAPYRISGTLAVSYRGRTTSGDSDNDVYGYLSLDGGNPEVDDALFHVLGRVTYDFDGGNAESDDPFYSLNDGSGGNVDSHVYEAFVDLRGGLVPGGFGLERVRIGRQEVRAAFQYLVDGVRFDFKRARSACDLEVSVFGGIPEYLYEDSRSGDWIAGGEACFRPWRDGEVTLRYAHVEDSSDWAGFQVDNYASLSLRQRLSCDFVVSGIWNTIDAGTRDVAVRFDWLMPGSDFEIHGAYRYQATITEEFTTVYDPYVGVLGTSYAFHQIDLNASKLFCCEHLGVDAGISGRILQDSDNEAAFNREFFRGWVTLSGYRWPSPDIDVALTGELWSAPGDNTVSAGGEITWRASDKLKFTTGSYYSLYKHDLFVVDEREDVTTIFLRAAWRVRKDLRLDGRVEYETTSDVGDYWTGVLGLTWSF